MKESLLFCFKLNNMNPENKNYTDVIDLPGNRRSHHNIYHILKIKCGSNTEYLRWHVNEKAAYINLAPGRKKIRFQISGRGNEPLQGEGDRRGSAKGLQREQSQINTNAQNHFLAANLLC